MLSLNELKQQAPSAADASVLAGELYEQMRSAFDAEGLELDAGSDLMFSNHILCLAKRIEKGEFVDPLDEALFSELSDKARFMARCALEPAFERCGAPIDTTEVLMVATHIEVAMAKAATSHMPSSQNAVEADDAA